MTGAARRLLLIRHGDTSGESSIRFHGSNDVPLSERGREQIRALAPLLGDLRPGLILHSPLRRAVESAAILTETCGWPRERLHVDARLREIHFGACEGLTAEQIAAAFPAFWREHQAGRATGFPDGEPREQFARRVAEAFAELVARPWHGDVAVVAHRGTLRHGLRHLFGLAPGVADEFATALGSATVVRDAGGWTIERFNVTG